MRIKSFFENYVLAVSGIAILKDFPIVFESAFPGRELIENASH
jgi:hypothetical protein